MDCTIYVAETKALISSAVTAKLICVFVFAYTKIRFSHGAAHIESQQNYRGGRVSNKILRIFKYVHVKFWQNATLLMGWVKLFANPTLQNVRKI